jgi:hypothetical protein
VTIGLNGSAGTGFELLAPVSPIAGASRFVRQNVYRSRLPRSIGNRNQCASLVSLTLACAAESKSTPIVVSLSGASGTRSKRNFHRPESNWGIPLNSTFRVFIVLQPQLRLQIRAPRQSTGSVPQTRKKCSNLSFQESDFSSYYCSQALEDRYFTKREIFRCFAAANRSGSTQSDAQGPRNLLRNHREKTPPREPMIGRERGDSD